MVSIAPEMLIVVFPLFVYDSKALPLLVIDPEIFIFDEPLPVFLKTMPLALPIIVAALRDTLDPLPSILMAVPDE